MKDIGRTTCSTVLEYRYTVMETNMKECSNRADAMAKEHTIIQLDRYTKADGLMAELKALECAHGPTVKNMKGNGSITKNMDRVSTAGLMAGAMREITETIKSMAMGPIFGRMEENILENGRMIKDMEEEPM